MLDDGLRHVDSKEVMSGKALPGSFVLRGPSGSGKTKLMKALGEKGALYINLEEGMPDLSAINASCVLLDNLSSLDGWESVLQGLLSEGKRVIASSASYVPCSFLPSLVLLPPSFSAMLGDEEPERAFHRYLYEGSLGYGKGLPEDSRIRKKDAYLRVLQLVSSELGHSLSVADISRRAAVSKETAKNYLRYALEDGVLFAVRSRVNSKTYCYFTDNSLLWMFRPRSETALYENAAALALYRKHREGLGCLKQHGIDFLAPDGTAVRVKLRLDRFSRAKNPGSGVFDSIPGAERYVVVTEREEAELVIRGEKVMAVPCWKWLLAVEEDGDSRGDGLSLPDRA